MKSLIKILMESDYVFWNHWKMLWPFLKKDIINQEIYTDLSKKVLVVWSRCDNKSEVDININETWNISGILINRKYESHETKEERNKIQAKYKDDLSKLSSYCYEKIITDFNCILWNDIIDLKANLEWIACNKTFCFYCLIDYLKDESNCPNCKAKITLNGIKTNRELKNYLDTWMTIGEKKGIEWRAHLKNWEIFCKNWEEGVWTNWILQKFHLSHELISITEAFEEILNKIDYEIKENDSMPKQKQEYIIQLDNLKEIGTVLIANKLIPFFSKINEISNELIANYNNRVEEHKNEVKKSIDNWLIFQNELWDLKKLKDKSIIGKINKKLNEHIANKNKVDDWIQEIKKDISSNLNIELENIFDGSINVEFEKLAEQPHDLEYILDLKCFNIVLKFKFIDIEKWKILVNWEDNINGHCYFILKLKPDNIFQFSGERSFYPIIPYIDLYEIGQISKFKDADYSKRKIEFKIICWHSDHKIKVTFSDWEGSIIKRVLKEAEEIL